MHTPTTTSSTHCSDDAYLRFMLLFAQKNRSTTPDPVQRPIQGPIPLRLPTRILFPIFDNVEKFERWVDTKFPKVFSCIPLVGLISAYKNENFIKHEINQGYNLDTTCKLLRAKNHYVASSIIRNTLSTAIVVSVIAMGLLTTPLTLAAGALAGLTFSGLLYNNIYAHRKNRQILSNLETFPPHARPPSPLNVK